MFAVSAMRKSLWRLQAAGKRGLRGGIAGLAIAVFAGLTACQKTSPAPEAAAPAAAAKPTAPNVPEGVRNLLGRWMRADGGYVLELKSADLSGAVEAAYFNPKPIRVSRAIWMQGPAGFQIVVELNDVGYPGALYELSPDAKGDRLVGKYTQPAMRESFEIEFARQPK